MRPLACEHVGYVAFKGGLPNSAGAVISLFGLNAYGRVAAFIGRSGAGKSTLAVACARLGANTRTSLNERRRSSASTS